MLNKDNIKDIDPEDLGNFMSAWLTKNQECMEEAYSIERAESTFEQTVISFIQKGLLQIPYNIGDFGDK